MKSALCLTESQRSVSNLFIQNDMDREKWKKKKRKKTQKSARNVNLVYRDIFQIRKMQKSSSGGSINGGGNDHVGTRKSQVAKKNFWW